MPQHFVLNNTGECENITTHWLLCLGLYRGFYVLNWLYRWAFERPPPIWYILTGLLQTGLYADFFYIYYNQ